MIISPEILRGVKGKLKYLEECGVNCVHLMPFLDSPKGRSDGGYAVADFRKVKPELGTIEDLADLAEACHEKDMNLCMDFVMNHTSEDHEWAQKARMGEGEYMSRYFFCDNENYVREYEKTVPQVFPETAPGNFTWLPEIGHYVLTTFYPYQWDLNYKNPRVFNEMMYNFLFLVNQGIDILRIDAVPLRPFDGICGRASAFLCGLDTDQKPCVHRCAATASVRFRAGTRERLSRRDGKWRIGRLPGDAH